MKYLLDSSKLQCVEIRSSIDSSNGNLELYYIRQLVAFAFIFPLSNTLPVDMSIDQMILIFNTETGAH